LVAKGVTGQNPAALACVLMTLENLRQWHSQTWTADEREFLVHFSVTTFLFNFHSWIFRVKFIFVILPKFQFFQTALLLSMMAYFFSCGFIDS